MTVTIVKRSAPPKTPAIEAPAYSTSGTNGRVVVGLDVSTQTGLVVMGAGSVVVDEEIDVRAVEIKTPYQRMQRSLQLGQKVYAHLSRFKPVIAVIEGYGYANPFSAFTLAELGTAVRFACIQANVPFVEVPPLSLKKFIGGGGVVKKGSMTKDRIMMLTLKRWGFESKTNNIADAYGLARIGLCYSGLVPMATDYERTLIGSLKSFK